jgi:TM2 domain-containing membrane protein YozV
MKKTLSILFAMAMSITFAVAQIPSSNAAAAAPAAAEMAEWVEQPSADYASPMQLTDMSFPTEQDVQSLIAQNVDNPDQTVAALLNIFLGDFGIGHFYTGQTTRGILDIIFSWTGIPAIIGIVEGIIWLCDSDAQWQARVEGWRK